MALANLEQYRFHGAAFQSFFCARCASQQESMPLHDITEIFNIIDIGGIKMLRNELSPKLISGSVICGAAVAMCGAIAVIYRVAFLLLRCRGEGKHLIMNLFHLASRRALVELFRSPRTGTGDVYGG